MNYETIKNAVEAAVHALYRQFGIAESEEDNFAVFLVQKIHHNSELYSELIEHPHGEENMRYFVIREALLRREFFVETPLGKLRVYAKHETDNPSDFPGVFVDLVTPKYPDGDILACVEYNSSDGDLMTTVYEPGQDEPCELVHHKLPSLARIETDSDGKLRYFDRNGTEILVRDEVSWLGSGTSERVYRADDGQLGLDNTNPTLVELGKMKPCQMGITPLTLDDLNDLEVVK